MDETILERVSEADVVAWMHARLALARRVSNVQMTSLNLDVSNYEHSSGSHLGMYWCGHAGPGACVVGRATVDAVIAGLGPQCTPAAEAARKREAAKKLMDEAAQIERDAAPANPTLVIGNKCIVNPEPEDYEEAMESGAEVAVDPTGRMAVTIPAGEGLLSQEHYYSWEVPKG